ncbi:STAS domain-containing protein [Micromonospora sp. WMMD980]|uniref:STAS domain-containing protein n=1 Tax=Micromonospora sp. WMMD980 TaxID=3016088 RepID=UPI002415CC8C|nr:STAS domain-containing protein [Micromonospora sp. WMMD980]MDG4801241.1 STAS domain-containing protein [Micromonospora sp. WMMD980]
MLSPLLTIEVDRLDAGSARLRLAGELDFDTAPELVEAAAELRRDGHQELWLDFTGVTLCDSSGLSALVVIHRSGTGAVHVTDLNPQVRQLLDRTGLAELLPAPPRVAPGDAREVG